MDLYLGERRFGANRCAVCSAVILFILLIAPVPSRTATAPTGENPASPSGSAHLAKILAAGAVDTVLFWDHFFTRPSTVVSSNYLSRVDDRKSRYYSLYANYKQGRISREQLVASLPHVVLIGDSLSKNFYISSVPSVFWRARTEEQRNWFLDTNSSPGSIYSLYERIDKLTPLVATEYARDGAIVSPRAGDEDLLHMVGRAHNFGSQVNQTLKEKRFPDLLLLWIGHNNLCWTTGLTEEQKRHPEVVLPKKIREFKANYVSQLRRLVERAKKEDHKVAIVVFGLVNAKGYFESRETAEEMRASDHKLFPYLEVDYVRCEAMKPEYRQNLIRMQLMVNRELKSAVRGLRDELRSYPKVRLQYSDALATKDISDVTLISSYDAWHLSRKGHDVTSETVFDAIGPSLDFLGIKPEPQISRR